MFVSRSSRENPSPFERCIRTTSPSRYSTAAPRASSSAPTTSAIVDFPAPERPVNHTTMPVFMGQPSVGRSRAYGTDGSMDAALDLVGVGPPPRALVLVAQHRPRARHAADRRVAAVVERVVRDLVDDDVRLHALRVPVDERVDLPDAVALAPLDLPRVLAGQALLAADARDPRAVRLEGALERLDLADMAAAVGIALPQVRPLLTVLLGDRHDARPDQVQAVALDEPLTRLVRLGE